MKSVKKISCLMAMICSTLFIACNDNDDGKALLSESAIIGIYFGECGGDCATMYQLVEEEIYPDIIENGYAESPEFSDIPLVVVDDVLSEFKDIKDSTPDFILNSSEESFGCPDCGDWGAIHYQLGDQSWTLDNAVENNPVEIQDFVRRIQALLEELR